MKLTIEADPKEIAALVVAIQERQEKSFTNIMKFPESQQTDGEITIGIKLDPSELSRQFKSVGDIIASM